MLSIGSYGQHLYPVLHQEKRGFIDSLGNQVVPPVYQKCSFDYEGDYGLMKSSDGWKIINGKGIPIIAQPYDSIGVWSQNITIGFSEDCVDLLELVGTSYQLKIKIDSLKSYRYKEKEYLQLFKEGFTFLMSKKGKYTFKNLKLTSFSSPSDYSFFVEKNGLIGIYTFNEKPFLKIKYDSIKGYDAGVLMYQNGLVGFKKRQFYRDIKTKKQDIVYFPCKYEKIRTFGEHFYSLEKDGLKSIFDIQTKQFVAHDLPKNILPFTKYFHKIKEGTDYGLCRVDGLVLSSTKFKKLLDSGHPDRILYVKNGLFGFLNEKGEELSSAYLDKVYPFEAWGLLPRVFTKYKTGTKFGLVNINGDTLTNAKYESIRMISDDRAACMNSDSSAVVYIIDKQAASIDDWYDLVHINQLSVVKETRKAGIKNLYVGEEKMNSRYYSYQLMNKLWNGKAERYNEGLYSNIKMREINEYKLFLLYQPLNHTEDPLDEVFVLMSNYSRNDNSTKLDVKNVFYKSVHLIGDNVLRGVRADGRIDFMDLKCKRKYIKYKEKGIRENFLIQGIKKGNKYYPRVYEVERDRRFKRYLLPYNKFKSHHVSADYDSLIFNDRIILGRETKYWNFAKPDTLKLPAYTISVSVNDSMVMSEVEDTSYYIFDHNGNQKYRFEAFEVKHISNHGMALVKLNDKYNYLRPNGELLIDSNINDAMSFKNGFANIKVENGYSVLNQKGQIVISGLTKSIQFNKLGVGVFYERKKYGLMDTSGVIIDSAKYSYLKPIKEGDSFLFQLNKSDGFGVIKSSGEIAVEGVYKKIKPLSHSFVLLTNNSGKFGFYDLQNNVLFKSKYNRVKSVKNNSYTISKGTKTGLYMQGKGLVVPVKQIGVSSFKNGFAKVKSNKGEFYVTEGGGIQKDQPEKVYQKKLKEDTLYYDKEGEYVGINSKNIPVRYHEIRQLENNTCFVAKRMTRFRLHNYSNEEVLSSDTWLSSEIIDNNILEVRTTEGVKYYNILLGNWINY